MGNQYLVIALALVSLLTSAALLMNWAGNKQIPGLLKIVVGFMIACAGTLLLTQRGELSALITIFFANILIMGGRIPILFGLASFWNQDIKNPTPLFSLGSRLCSRILLFRPHR